MARNMYRKIATALLLSSSLILFTACPHKYTDPGLEEIGPDLFSLPAQITQGTIVFYPYMYRTAGSFQITQYGSYNGQKVTYNVVGSEIQFQKEVQSNGAVIYKPKWVISGARSQDDIINRKNLIIITILPDFDNVPNNHICSNSSNITASNFCDNLLTTGNIFGPYNSTTAKDFFSYESNTYAQCTGSGGSGILPFDTVPPAGTGFSLDSDTTSTNCVKETSFNSAGVGSGNLKKFNVVVEFLNDQGELFTSLFPYNGDVDNLGNHTPVKFSIKNFPDPAIDPATYGSVSVKTDKEICTNDACTPISDPANDTTNCTGLQTNVGCNQLVAATNASITSTNNQDDDIIHKLQQAGKEHRAKGTDVDPRFEMNILGIAFEVERAPNKFLD